MTADDEGGAMGLRTGVAQRASSLSHHGAAAQADGHVARSHALSALASRRSARFAAHRDV